jgi:Ca2+-binding RTX toxin-like protein
LGTPKNDFIIGTSQKDLIKGKEGNDLITDNEGNDNSFGNEGKDLFIDGAGNDTVRGEGGNDVFAGVTPGIAGDDLIDLGTGNDFALGGKGADTFVLNRDPGAILIRDFTPGEDRFAFGDNLTKDDLKFARLDNNSSFNGGTSISDANTGELIAFVDSATVEAVSNAEFVNVEDILPTDNASTTVEESPEPIEVESPPAQSGEISGTPNPDILVGDEGNNLIRSGNEGNNQGDFINSGGGEDLVFGEAGNDVLNGEADNDVLNGEAGNDVLNGGADIDVFNGDEGADTLRGEDGNDVISGGKGDDLLVGRDGNDVLFGDGGQDTFVLASGEGADIVFDFELDQDAIALTNGLSYDSLQIEYNLEGNYTNISEETGELITTLMGVEADQLTESDFTTI